MKWGEFAVYFWAEAGATLWIGALQYRRCDDVVNLTSWFEYPDNVFNKAFIVRRRYLRNFEVMLSTLLKLCELVVRSCDITTTLLQSFVFAGKGLKHASGMYKIT